MYLDLRLRTLGIGRFIYSAWSQCWLKKGGLKFSQQWWFNIIGLGY